MLNYFLLHINANILRHFVTELTTEVNIIVYSCFFKRRKKMYILYSFCITLKMKSILQVCFMLSRTCYNKENNKLLFSSGSVFCFPHFILDQ